MENKILLFGGSGRLGQAILELDPTIIAPTKNKCDITDTVQVKTAFDVYRPDIAINVAALVGTKECEKNYDLAWRINVDGAVNIAMACADTEARCVFTSSAVIFNGKKGRYKEDDPPSPTFYYAVTKVAAEQAVRMVPSHAVVRLDFFPKEGFKYPEVFEDHYTSKIPVTEAAKKVLQIAKSSFIGTMNIGQERDSLYRILKPYFSEIVPIKISDSVLPTFPRDISLDLTRWNQEFCEGTS